MPSLAALALLFCASGADDLRGTYDLSLVGLSLVLAALG
jgi:hypothetical protein